MSTDRIPPATGPPGLYAGRPPLEIVVPIAASGHDDARLTLAARYGQFWCLPLRLVHVSEPDQPSDGGTAVDEVVSRLGASHPEQVITGEELEADSVASGIGRAATDRSVVFLPSQRGSRWLDEQSVAVSVVQTFGGLVMLSGPECHDPPIGSSVIVPLDGSRLAERAVGPALAVAAVSGAVVWLVTVTPAASIDATSELLLEGIADAERRYLQQITSRHRDGPRDVRWETTSEGDPVASIEALAAEHEASLVVAATHGDTEGERQRFGSVCMGLVERGRVPVLIVTPGADAPT